jgi:hypothetical protein
MLAGKMSEADRKPPQRLCKSMVPRRRLELPRLAAQVPETCASTNSATWAQQRVTVNDRGGGL